MNGIRYERVFLRPGFPMSDPGPASAFQTPSGVPTPGVGGLAVPAAIDISYAGRHVL